MNIVITEQLQKEAFVYSLQSWFWDQNNLIQFASEQGIL
jgi:hypothetical protein